MSKYVIIGNSIAAIGCIEGIRSIDNSGEITIISDENYHVYSRPLISYLLLGKTTIDKMKYRPDTFYQDNNCKLILGKQAVNIDAVSKAVILDDNSRIEYDKLLIATGSSAFVPPIEGLDKVKNKYTFLTLDDALAMDKVIDNTSRVLIIGAGLIGLKCAEGIAKRVQSVSVVDIANKVLPSILDDESANIVKEHLISNGIDLRLSSSVAKLDENTATLSNSDKIIYDVLVIAVGVRPNVKLLIDIGGKVNRGILIDTYCRTSFNDIYSAGDCTECVDIASGETKIMALLPNAYMQGECAGINMAGGDKQFDKAIPMNAIGFFGLHIITAGNYVGDTYIDTKDKEYKKLYYSSNRLNGYIMIGNVDKAGIYTSLIRERIALDSIDFPLICKQPGLIAFSKEARRIKLGGY